MGRLQLLRIRLRKHNDNMATLIVEFCNQMTMLQEAPACPLCKVRRPRLLQLVLQRPIQRVCDEIALQARKGRRAM